MLIAQSAFSQTNYAGMKVDNLTDVQIRKMMERAESVGYSDAQLEQMAAAQGMTAEEIIKLRARVEKLRKTSGDVVPTGTDQSTERQADTTTNKITKNTKTPKSEKTDVFADFRPKIFGAELFANSDISFEPNLRMATPKGYIIGPDDELLIDLSGDNEVNYRLKVNPEGIITLQYVGPVAVAGLSIEQASSKIRAKMSSTYPALKSGRTSIAVNLGNIRSIKITLLGEVVKPGSYTLSSLSTVFNALNASGGPNHNGSFRNIQVIRGNKVVSTIDIYDFLLNGIQKIIYDCRIRM